MKAAAPRRERYPNKQQPIEDVTFLVGGVLTFPTPYPHDVVRRCTARCRRCGVYHAPDVMYCPNPACGYLPALGVYDNGPSWYDASEDMQAEQEFWT